MDISAMVAGKEGLGWDGGQGYNSWEPRGGGGSWAVCGTQVAVPILVYTGTPLRSPLLAALFI